MTASSSFFSLPVPEDAVTAVAAMRQCLLDGTAYEGWPQSDDGWAQTIAAPVLAAELRRLAYQTHPDGQLIHTALTRDSLMARADRLDGGVSRQDGEHQ